MIDRNESTVVQKSCVEYKAIDWLGTSYMVHYSIP